MLIRFRTLFTLAGLLLLIAGCSQPTATPTTQLLQDIEAAWPTEGWPTAAPESQGVDSRLLLEMLETIQRERYGIDSVTVIRNGFMVLDAAVYPYEQGAKHEVRSCTKSIVSLLIGIAMGKGYIEHVQTPVLDFFPGRTVGNLDANKESMTLEHLLTMTTGFRCRDSYLYRWSGMHQMRNSEDWIQFMLDLPMETTPGETFEYCNGASFLLSAILTETTDMSALEFAEKNLFGPLGITDVVWPANLQGISMGWGDLKMRPHDMAKIGYLALRGGQWAGDQIVSPSWVEASTREHIAATLEDGYGYQWWVDDSGMYMALGYGGQFIFVIPEMDLVVVFTSELREQDFYVPQELLVGYILPAVVSTEPLASDPAAEALLQERIEELSRP